MTWRLLYMPEVLGEMPVMMAVREGLQAVAGQWALLKRMPLAARRSRFGVMVCGCPPRQPIQSLRSSRAMKRMFGFLGSFCAAKAKGVIRKVMIRATDLILSCWWISGGERKEVFLF